MIEIEKPNITTASLSADGAEGEFVVEPLERGYGTTLGNSLRRILLSSLPGYAATAIKIDGVIHEISTVNGVKEDVPEIVLNVKGIVAKLHTPTPKTVVIDVTGPCTVTAGDINPDADIEILNPDKHLATVSANARFYMELTFGAGRGYVPADENRPEDAEFGLLPIDSIHTPIKNVKYSIENYRVEQKTDYEKLNLEITTDGSIHPKEALKEAAKILIQHFMLFSDEKITLNMEENGGAEEFDEDVLHMRQLLKTKLSDQDLSVRALNCLKAAEVDTVGDLVRYNRNDLLKFRNFGKKSLTELDDLLASLNLHFGMDVSIYKLDKD